MKKLLTIGLVMTIVFASISCKKSAAKPAAPAPVVNNTPTPVAMTSQDSMLSADWILDKHETYITGTVISTVNSSDPSNCHLFLKTSEVVVGNTPVYRNCVKGITCSNETTSWRVTNSQLEVSGISYAIVTLTSNLLTIQLGSISSGEGHKYYFHK